jgi:hypothetical protein
MNSAAPGDGVTAAPRARGAGPASRIVSAGLCIVATACLPACSGRSPATPPAPAGPTPIVPDAPPAPDVVQLAVGAHHACVRHRDGGVSCWGSDGGSGQMGDGGNVAHPAPRRVPGLRDVVAIAAGAQFTLALDRSGGVWCWGESACGAGGAGRRAAVTLRPRRVPIPRAAAVFAAMTTACARLESGATHCWGDLPAVGAEPDAWGGSWPAHAPTRAPLSRPVALHATIGTVCAVEQPPDRADAPPEGAVRCWSSSGLGELLAPPRPAHAAFDAVVPLPAPARAVAVDVGIVCAIVAERAAAAGGAAAPGAVPVDPARAVRCWGNGATSYGAPPGTSGPVALALPSPAELAVLQELVCARDDAGDVACVGRHGLRRGGRETWTAAATPTRIPDLDDAAQLAAGPGQLCVLRRDGAVRCAEHVAPPAPPGPTRSPAPHAPSPAHRR